ncbi:MAG: DNA methyltransferase [Promethearchaeota archaeon]
MEGELIHVKEKLPVDLRNGQVFSIYKDQNPFVTHNLYRYPTKYIPEVPRWAIERFAGSGSLILDPFCGSGTTNVEACLAGYHNLGFDINPFSVLLSRVKTTPFSSSEIHSAKHLFSEMIGNVLQWRREPGGERAPTPNLPSITHWFPEKNTELLSRFRAEVKKIEDENLRDFFWIVLARVLKRCSYADDQSPKPYVSSKYPKTPGDPVGELKKSFEFCLDAKTQFSQEVHDRLSQFRVFNSINSNHDETRFTFLSSLKDLREFRGKVDLAVTSPPYINAFDLVRTFKIELYWLDFLRSPADANEFKKKFLGTEKIYADTYQRPVDALGIPELDEKIREIYGKDKLRGHVVHKFFKDYGEHFKLVSELLTAKGRYVIVIGDSRIRGITIESARFLGRVAEEAGFTTELQFSYLIKDRYLRIPRQDRGGHIKYDRIVVLQKSRPQNI